MSFAIRSAIESDIPFILEGYRDINRAVPMQTDQQLTAQKIRDDILGQVPKAFINVAVYNETVIGFIFYSTVYFATTGVNAWVTNLYVERFAPRPGITSVGRRLLDNITIRHPDIKGVYAVTERNNKAMQSLITHYGGSVFEHFLFIGGPPRHD